ncbi:acetyltransferase, partial [Vibrio cholerae]|nr:acetyltransferase [Vibrio cholerae]
KGWNHQNPNSIVLKIQLLAFKLHNLAFELFLMLIWSNVLKVQWVQSR